MITHLPLRGLVAATHTPFHEDRSLHLEIVESQAAHLLTHGVRTAFIGGTTGESASLTLAERLALAERWAAVTRGTALQVIVHVGSNCVADAAVLAAQAQRLGASAISALAPSYFKPSSVASLVECLSQIAAAAPALPFYYYEIPSMTGLTLSPSEFLRRAADRIPNLAGIKFTSSNLMEYQLCRAAHDGRFDIPFGFDEMLLGALALGARGAVGSSFNFAAPLYNRLIAAFERGELNAAREEQLRSVRTIQALAARGYMGAAKAVMNMLGVDVGPARLPCGHLPPEEVSALRAELELMGFFDWVKP
jgi:N-acetylneuraminate lyase